MAENFRSIRLPLAVKAPQAHPHEPSPRNVEIFSRIREQGERQEDIAAEFGLSQGRVAQICKQVEGWRQWADERRETNAGAGEYTRGVRQLFRRRTQLLFALAVQGLSANPHDRQRLKLAVQVSEALAGMEQGLAPHERFAATTLGRRLEEMLLEVVAKLFPAAEPDSPTPASPTPASQTSDSPAGPPAGSAAREVPNITKFMQAPAAAAEREAGGWPARASLVREGSCGSAAATREAVMQVPKDK